MGSFESFLRAVRTDPEKPYGSEHINNAYDLLFCDEIDFYKNESSIGQYPWDIIFGNGSPNQLLEIINNPNVESKARIVAGRILKNTGIILQQKELLGVVIEISQTNGLGSIAAYKDGSIRYINYLENIIIWEIRTKRSIELISNLFILSTNFLEQIKSPCEGRKIFPSTGNVRLSFLTNIGLYYYETEFTKLQRGDLTESIMEYGVQLMLFLTQQKKILKIPGCVNVFG